MKLCPDCGGELVEVDNPLRREVRHKRGVICDWRQSLTGVVSPVDPPKVPLDPPHEPVARDGLLDGWATVAEPDPARMAAHDREWQR